MTDQQLEAIFAEKFNQNMIDKDFIAFKRNFPTLYHGVILPAMRKLMPSPVHEILTEMNNLHTAVGLHQSKTPIESFNAIYQRRNELSKFLVSRHKKVVTDEVWRSRQLEFREINNTLKTLLGLE